jgi:hypothetical protein
VIYTFLVCLILLVGLLFLVIGLSQGGGTAVVVSFLAPLATLLYLIFVRIYMELIAMFFRIGENTSIMAAKLTGQAPPPAAPGYGYDPGAPTGPPTPRSSTTQGQPGCAVTKSMTSSTRPSRLGSRSA